MSQSQKNHSAAKYAPVQARQAALAKAQADKRRQYIKAVKAKQRQLGMDDDTYRAMLQARTGKTSAKDCTLTELGLISNYLTSQGAVAPKAEARARAPARAGYPPRAPVALERQALRAKVDMLLAELTPLARLSDPEQYASAICQRNGWCSTLAFADCHILHKLVGALSTTLRSKQRSQQPRAA